MASDVHLDSLSSWVHGAAPLGLPPDAVAPPVRPGHWRDALPLLLTLLLVFLSPLLYDVGLWLQAR